MEGSGAVITTQQVPSFSAAVTGIVIGGPAGSPGAPVRFPGPLLSILRLGWRQQSLDLLQETDSETHKWNICPRLTSHQPLEPLLGRDRERARARVKGAYGMDDISERERVNVSGGTDHVNRTVKRGINECTSVFVLPPSARRRYPDRTRSSGSPFSPTSTPAPTGSVSLSRYVTRRLLSDEARLSDLQTAVGFPPVSVVAPHGLSVNRAGARRPLSPVLC